MKLLLISIVTICLLMLIIMLLILLVSKKIMIDSQKATPFECGFNPMNYSRIPFSTHFFLIAVIFLIFDIEIVMIMPMIMVMKFTMMKYWLYTSILFLIILIMGLYHEWNNGMINWYK